MSTSKLTVTELRDFLDTEEGWRLFLVALNGMADFHRAIIRDDEDRRAALSAFESQAALVDFLNALLNRKGTDGNE